MRWPVLFVFAVLKMPVYVITPTAVGRACVRCRDCSLCALLSETSQESEPCLPSGIRSGDSH